MEKKEILDDFPLMYFHFLSHANFKKLTLRRKRQKIGKQVKGDFFFDALSIILHHPHLPRSSNHVHIHAKNVNRISTATFIHPISFLNLTSLILFVNKEHHLYHHPHAIHSFISSSCHELLSHEKSCDEGTGSRKSVCDGN